MARPTSKTDLISASEANYKQMNELISSFTEKELSTPFQFGDEKKEAHWKRDKNIRDILIHLYEWHQLLLNWVSSNLNGEAAALLPQPYNWRTYGKMNEEFWKKHQNTALEEASRCLKNHTRK